MSNEQLIDALNKAHIEVLPRAEHPIYYDILALSSGTIASISGYTDFEMIELYHQDLAAIYRVFHNRHSAIERMIGKREFENWMDVYKFLDTQDLG